MFRTELQNFWQGEAFRRANCIGQALSAPNSPLKSASAATGLEASWSTAPNPDNARGPSGGFMNVLLPNASSEVAFRLPPL